MVRSSILSCGIELDLPRSALLWVAAARARSSGLRWRAMLTIQLNRGTAAMNKHKLPEIGYPRLRDIIGDRKADPPIPAVIPVSKSTWWAGVKSGRFPAPVKIGPGITAWRWTDIGAIISAIDRGETK